MIHSDVRPILIFLIALFVTMFILPKLANIAKKINLLDWPSERKVHVDPKPLVGGLGFVISACFAAALIMPATGLRGFFAGLTVMLFIGFLDDLKELGHRQKFMGQILAVALLIYFSNIRLVSFGNLLGLGDIIIPGYWLSVLISIFCLLGVINAINLIDGLDGLAGGIGFVAFLLFAAHASLAQNQTFLLLNLAFAGALLGFLRFNWHPAKLFMGDAGSLSLGFALAFMSLGMTQGDNACMSPISALLILSIPIADTLTVMTKRILQGTSPFHADKKHLHHIFMRYGFSRENTVKIIIGLSILLGSISIVGRIYNLTDSTLFLFFAIYLIFYFISSFFILDLLRYSCRFRRKRDSCGAPCKALKFICQSLDIFNIIRSDTRHAVSIPARYYTTEKDRYLDGTITNISKSGFMASIPQLTTLESTFFTKINFENQDSANIPPLEFTIEHLWIATQDEKHIHGFKFKDLTAEQKSVLNLFTNTLKKSKP
ncbi:UDP-N-acetylmuramyl pentapeptide phosphotransferase/UDP-N-acetylglucosamine-1-phosphate transferase [Desulfocapsa sulfexigens DSM 10523]|uniref:UDP-N-acetylmuramyl pentapeptide phosphotransferase/UDP-N-acetylglucosamine-1-phosphate transferase n=1 Tax=Desulfocapsa sulfexigens (strain DSM 10523 / SB164P1) TaxID=1167006 RepID=M1P9L5_DESSD|nr:UDP-N-acetylmuramyl pentapeptide phosphotransferase/UDP-N-acetylglucosamine-1-phosphate transferase [Desulfocapsa sulfexigens DSM 10523]